MSHYSPEYNLTDHLGNVRVTFSNGRILSKAHYYPFGMLIGDISQNNTNPQNNYLYNGKELQNDFGLDWYDYGARFYDAQLGRWHVVDPLAEVYYEWSPYNYVAGNPIIFIDTDGMGIYDGRILVNVSINSETGAATYERVDGKALSKSFLNNGARIINAMATTETGRASIYEMTNSPTEIKLHLTDEIVYNEFGEATHANTWGSEDLDNLGNYKSADIEISTAEISGVTDRFTDASDEEKINAKGVHETVHLRPEQIEIDNQFLNGEIDIYHAENEPTKQEYKTRTEYRDQNNVSRGNNVNERYEEFLKKGE